MTQCKRIRYQANAILRLRDNKVEIVKNLNGKSMQNTKNPMRFALAKFIPLERMFHDSLSILPQCSPNYLHRTALDSIHFGQNLL